MLTSSIFELTISCWVDKMSHVHVVSSYNLIGTARASSWKSTTFFCGCYHFLSSPSLVSHKTWNRRNETKPETTPNCTFPHDGQLHDCCRRYKHYLCPVADCDGCLVSRQDVYILLSEREKCGLGGELLPLRLRTGRHCKFTYASRSTLRTTKYFAGTISWPMGSVCKEYS